MQLFAPLGLVGLDPGASEHRPQSRIRLILGT
jgi:hypothetical protein